MYLINHYIWFLYNIYIITLLFHVNNYINYSIYLLFQSFSFYWKYSVKISLKYLPLTKKLSNWSVERGVRVTCFPVTPNRWRKMATVITVRAPFSLMRRLVCFHLAFYTHLTIAMTSNVHEWCLESIYAQISVCKRLQSWRIWGTSSLQLKQKHWTCMMCVDSCQHVNTEKIVKKQA